MKAFVGRYPFLCFAVLTLAYQFGIVGVVKSMLAEGQMIHDNHTAHQIFRLRVFGPLVFAVGLTFFIEGAAGVKKLFSSFFKWKTSPGWYVLGFFWKFILGYLGVLSVGALFGFWPKWWMVPEFWYGWGGNILFICGIAFVEETAWISYSLARMQSRFTAFKSVLIVGACWAAWYLPMVIINDGVPAGYPVPVFACSMMALTALLAWMYNSTKGSGTVLLIAQFVSNTTFFVAPVLPEVVSSPEQIASANYEVRPVTAFVVFFFITAVILVLKYGRENLSATGTREQWFTGQV